MENVDSKRIEPSADRVNFLTASSLKVANWLVVLLAAFWFILGVFSLVRMLSEVPDITGWGWIIVLLMFVNSAVLVWIGWGIRKAQKFYLYLAILVIGGNLILTLTDEFGIIDLLTLVINICLLLLLFFARAEFITGNE